MDEVKSTQYRSVDDDEEEEILLAPKLMPPLPALPILVHAPENKAVDFERLVELAAANASSVDDDFQFALKLHNELNASSPSLTAVATTTKTTTPPRHPPSDAYADDFDDLHDLLVALELRERLEQEERDAQLAQEIAMQRSPQMRGATSRREQEERDAEMAHRLAAQSSPDRRFKVKLEQEERDAEMARVLQGLEATASHHDDDSAARREQENHNAKMDRDLVSALSLDAATHGGDDDFALAQSLQADFDHMEAADRAALEAWDRAMAFDLQAEASLWSAEERALMEIFPAADPHDIRSALASCGNDPDEAFAKLSVQQDNFPSLRQAVAATKGARPGASAAARPPGASAESPWVDGSTTSWSLQQPLAALRCRFRTVPEASLRSALERSGGFMDEAEHIVAREYPAEYLKGIMSRPTARRSAEPADALHGRGQRAYKANAMTLDEFVESLKHWSSATSAGDHDVLYEAFRSDAERLGSELRREALRRRDLSAEGRTAEARDLDAKLERIRARLAKAKRDAAEAIFAQNNPRLCDLVARASVGDAPDPSELACVPLDLHMLHVDEALQRVVCVLRLAFMWRWPSLKVIVGKGNHSASGSKLHEPVRRVLEGNLAGPVLSAVPGEQGGYFLVKIRQQHA